MEIALKFIGIFSLAVPVAYGLIKYFSEKIFENYLSKSLENHKSNLERINITHEVQYTSLHKERAIVIRELYQKLFEYKMAIVFFFNINLDPINEVNDLEQRVKNWKNTAPDFSSYFHKNRIYFSEDLCAIIDKLNNELDNINKETTSFLKLHQNIDQQVSAIKSKGKTFMDLQDKVNNYLTKDIEKITNELEYEFRKILGVE